MNGNVVTFSGFVRHRKPSRRMHRSWRSAARARVVNHQFTCLRAGPHCCIVASREPSRLRRSAERAGGSVSASAYVFVRPALLLVALPRSSTVGRRYASTVRFVDYHAP